MRDKISRQAAIDAITSYNGVVDKSVAKRILIQLPSAQPEIVECKDCKHRGKQIADGRYWCSFHYAFMYYCSDAERRTNAFDACTN